MNSKMIYSKKGIKLTEDFEGCKLTSYRDVKGILTIGYGHTGPDVKENQTITLEYAEQLLQSDISWAETTVNNLVLVNLNQNQFDACVDFVFNCGSANFRSSTLLKLINNNELYEASLEFAKWDKSGGVIYAGLERRRQAETNEFNS